VLSPLTRLQALQDPNLITTAGEFAAESPAAARVWGALRGVARQLVNKGLTLTEKERLRQCSSESVLDVLDDTRVLALFTEHGATFGGAPIVVVDIEKKKGTFTFQPLPRYYEH
jgi:hypothetical protein